MKLPGQEPRSMRSLYKTGNRRKIILNIYRTYTTNNSIDIEQSGKGTSGHTPCNNSERPTAKSSSIHKSTTTKSIYNRTFQLTPNLPSPEHCSRVAVWPVSNMQMCVDDRCTDLQALGVGTNKVIDFLP